MLNFLINYIAPIIGIIGFVNNNVPLMLIAIVLNIIPFFSQAILRQSYQIKFLIILFIIAFIVSKLFHLTIFKSLTIFMVFTNAILLCFTSLLFILGKLFRKKSTTNSNSDISITDIKGDDIPANELLVKELPKEETHYCPYCGNLIIGNWKYCYNCRKEIKH